MEQIATLVPFIGIALLFWLLIIRPQSRRQKAVTAMQSALEPGAEVMLSSGLYGQLERVEDDHVMLRVADGVTLKFAKGAVANVVEPEVQELSPTHSPSSEES